MMLLDALREHFRKITDFRDKFGIWAFILRNWGFSGGSPGRLRDYSVSVPVW